MLHIFDAQRHTSSLHVICYLHLHPSPVAFSWLLLVVVVYSWPPTDDEPFRYEFAAPLGT